LDTTQQRRAAHARALLAAPWLPLAAALFVGLALRMAFWGNIPRLGLISDEGEYLSAASWLAQGRGFAWYHGYLWTRAPLYPLFVATHLRLFGESLQPVYVTQTLLSLLNIALTYALARCVTASPLAHLLAALLTALYLPLALYPQLLLSETLFITLLLAAFLALSMTRKMIHGEYEGRAFRLRALRGFQTRWLLAAGALFGLATLTRSLALGFVPLVALWLVTQYRGDLRAGAARAGLFALAFGLVLLPWTLHSSRIYGGLVVVDTSGAFNLLLGARTAYDGQRSNAPTRDIALALLGQLPADAPPPATCAPFPGALESQAARQAAMTREGWCLAAARPLAFAQKSVAELVDLFQINYTGAERFTDGFSTGRLPPWYVAALFLLDDTIYVFALPLAVVGWAVTRGKAEEATAKRLIPHPSSLIPLSSLIGLWWLYNLAAAPLLFAINRFRLPLLPFAFIFAAIALVHGAQLVPQRHQGTTARTPIPDLRALVSSCLRGERQSLWMALNGLLALLLWIVAATPYAYLEPREPGEPSRWASYLGPYPSSIETTSIALAARRLAVGDAHFAAAIQAGDLAEAANALDGPVGSETARLGPALLAARQGDTTRALAVLPSPETIAAEADAHAAVLRGDLLRTLGDEAGARAAFTPRFVDEANPVAWAWEWLRPAPTSRIDLGGNLDLGYIAGCFLGEGDIIERATYRWCGDGARLRFPQAGTGAPQRLVLRADGRGWPTDMPLTPVRVLVDGRDVGTFTPDRTAPREFEIALPAALPGADIIVTLRGATFVPGPERYLHQQSESSLGQVQRLAVRLDWAELQNVEP
jgi:hypothetical protein